MGTVGGSADSPGLDTRRLYLAASVGPRASLVLLRQFGAELVRYAEAMAASPDPRDQEPAREVRAALAQFRSCAAQLTTSAEELPRWLLPDAADGEPSRWISTEEAADVLKVGARQVRKLIDRDDLVARRGSAGAWLVDRESVGLLQVRRGVA